MGNGTDRGHARQPSADSAYGPRLEPRNPGRGADEMAASEIEGRQDMPGWQNAFTLSPNVRFSRTPEAVLARKPAEPSAPSQPLIDVPANIEPGLTQAVLPAPLPTPVPEVPAAVVMKPVPTVYPPQTVGARAITYRLRRELELQAKARAEAEALGQTFSNVAAPVLPVEAAPAVVTASVPEVRSGPFLSDHIYWEALNLDFSAPVHASLPDAALVAHGPQAEPVAEPQPVMVADVAALTAPLAPVATAPVDAAPRRIVFSPLRAAAPLPTVSAFVPTPGTPVLAAAVTAAPSLPPRFEDRDWPVTALYREIAVRSAPAAALELPVVAPVEPAPVAIVEPVAPQPQPAPTVIMVPPLAVQSQPRAVTADGEAEYEFPSVELLQVPRIQETAAITAEALEQSAGLLESVLEDFGIKGEIIDVRPGPVVTLYEFEPAPGVKSSRVIGLSDDIARSMSALSARVAVVPGRNVIGIELPNPVRETVYFRELIESVDYAESRFHLPVCLGKTIGGEPVIAELSKMPHLLVAGTTGSGKSVAINTMILSLLYRLKPEECRLIMVDPKMLELSVYDGIPHLLTPVVTDPKKAVMALKWAVREMEERYKKMSRLGVRNIDGYNTRAASARAKGETILCSVQTGFDRNTGEIVYEQEEMDLTAMPYIVVIVDEMADLMMVAGKEIEGAIQRLAQMARAAGIHLIMATQRPSVDVITGTIKANFPTRISFQVTSKIDSRTILGEPGAEHLLGQGDMLHMVGGGRIARVHGPFVSDSEVEKVVAHLKTQGRPEYLGTVTEDADEAEEPVEEETAVFDKSAMGEEDQSDLYEKAVKLVMRDKKCSTSYIQRRLGVGYNRAASLVERMENEGLVGPANHVGKRAILTGGRDAAPMRDMSEVPGADSDF